MSAGQVILMMSWPPVLQMHHLEQMGFDERFVREYGSAEYHALWKRKAVTVPPIPMFLAHGENTKRFPQARLMAWLEAHFAAGVVRERLAKGRKKKFQEEPA